MSKYSSILLLLLTILSTACQSNRKQETITESKAMVVTAHYLASEVGQEILQQGGNAYDAAVAVQFALAVVYPRAGNITGGGFAVIRTSKGEYNALDFREKAPLAATRDMYLDEKGDANDKLSRDGHLSVGVPGSVDGMVRLHQRYGRLPWGILLQPAINLAKTGFPLTLSEANKLNNYRDRLLKINMGKQNIPYISDSLFSTKDSLFLPKLASTLERIQGEGRDGFYKGETADALILEMKNHNGIITRQDLEQYSSIWRSPVIGEYRNHKIISMPPPSSGGIALLQLLKGAEKFNLNQSSFGSSEHIHTMIELERRVYADRSIWLGDPDFYDVPTQRLLSQDYINERFSDIHSDKKTDSQDIKAGKVDLIESFETTHFSIIDKEGNAVAITTTLNGNYGSKVYVESCGFLLNNEMDDFSAKVGHPNQFGLIGNDANAIAPGKRMLSSMTPTLVEKDNELFMIVGSPGGSTIITSVFQNIINVIDFGMNIEDAVNSPRIHSQYLPDKVYYEPKALNETTKEELKKMGHILVEQNSIGTMSNILVNDKGIVTGAADTIRHPDGSALPVY